LTEPRTKRDDAAVTVGMTRTAEDLPERLAVEVRSVMRRVRSP
jgi:hypothetical protein